MKRWTCIALVSVFATIAFAQDAEKPDLSKLDAETLRAVAMQLYRTVADLKDELVAAKERAEAAEAEAAKLSKERARLAAELAAMKAKIAASPELQAQLTQAEKVEKAIEDGELIVGMTVEQADRSLKEDGRHVGTGEFGDELYEWKVYRDMVVEIRRDGQGNSQAIRRPQLIATYIANVRDGKIVSFGKH